MKPLSWHLTVEAVGDPNAATPIPTARQLWPTPLRVQHVDVFALPGNDDRIYIGDWNVSAILGTQAGTPMSAGDVKSYDDVDLSSIWITAVIVGDGVSCEAELADDTNV